MRFFRMPLLKWKKEQISASATVAAITATAASESIIAPSAAAAKKKDDPQTTVIAAAITTSGEDVIVEIADNGPKLSEDDLKRLNAPLSSTKKSGLGLGLPIVQGLVARCGGTIAFRRIPTGGLLCRVHLPVSPSEQQELQL